MSQVIKTTEDIAGCTDNKIILSDPESFSMKNSEIIIHGENNILFCEEGVSMENCRVIFNANDSVVYFSKNRHIYRVDVTVNNGCVCYLGKEGYYNGAVHIICSEGKSVFIGDEALVSFGVWIRTADPHLVYSAETHDRINPSKSVYIGDHVWIGQNALILKGSRIHSGSILGGGAVLAGKSIPSNTSYAGNPAKEVGNNLFWADPCVHKWTPKQTKYHKHFKGKDPALFREDADTVLFGTVDGELGARETADEKLDYLMSLSSDYGKNRFALNGRTSLPTGSSMKKSIKKAIKSIVK